ncbi:hypothetical protein SMICM304S_01378 [Streptomyces microflavus]
MAMTLRAANQNSNSPKFFTAARFVPRKITMNRATQAHSGVPGSQPLTIWAAPMPSRPTATQSRNQKDQPAVNPAQGPIAGSACTEKEPEAGLAADISPSMRITIMTSSTATRTRRRSRARRRRCGPGAHEEPGAEHHAAAAIGEVTAV